MIRPAAAGLRSTAIREPRADRPVPPTGDVLVRGPCSGSRSPSAMGRGVVRCPRPTTPADPRYRVATLGADRKDVRLLPARWWGSPISTSYDARSFPMGINGQSAAGVTVPDTKLARDATDLVRAATTDLVYHHSRRVFW